MNGTFIRSLYLAAAVTVLAAEVALSQTGTITGRVTEGSETGRPVEGAKVKCTLSNDPRPRCTGQTTGRNGEFTLADAPAGEGQLIIKARKYRGNKSVLMGESVATPAQEKSKGTEPTPIVLREQETSRPPGSGSTRGVTTVTLVAISLTRPAAPRGSSALADDDDGGESVISGVVTTEDETFSTPGPVHLSVSNDDTDEVIFETELKLTADSPSSRPKVEFKFTLAKVGNYNLQFFAEDYHPASYLIIKQAPGRRMVEGVEQEVIPLLVIEAEGTPVANPSAVRVSLKPLERAHAEESGQLTNTQDSIRRSVFQPSLMESLPVAGMRGFDAFALLAPGVLPPPQSLGADGPGVSPGVGAPGQFSANGLRSRENNFIVDGSDNNDEDVGVRRQGFVFLTPQQIESLSEFQIITALADARFGRNLGGHVNVLTKTGERHFHGSLYGYLTADRLNARDPFDQTSRGGPPSFTLTRSTDDTPVMLDGRPLVLRNPVEGKNPLTRWQAGLTVSGPTKPLADAFFFGSLERVRTSARRESHFAVPTVKQRGVYDTGETGVLDTEGFPDFPLYPASLPGNALFSLYPFPNNPSGPYGRNTYTSVLPADEEGTRFSVKLQKQLGKSDPEPRFKYWHLLWAARGDTITGRYYRTQDRATLPVTGGALFSSLRPGVRTQNIALFLNRTLSSNMFDVVRLSYGRTNLSFEELRDPFLLPSSFFPDTRFLLNAPLLLNVTAPNEDGTLNPTSYVSASSPQGTALLNSLGYEGITQAEQIAGALGQVVIPGFSPVGVDVNYFPQSRVNNTFQAADTITYLNGRNIFTFGFDFRKNQINSTQDKNFRPLATFNGLRATAPLLFVPLVNPDGTDLPRQTFSGSTLAAAGLPTGLFQTLAVTPDSNIGLRFAQINLFFQVERRLTSNLRVMFGARYELNTVPETVGGRLEKAFDPARLRKDIDEALPICSLLVGQEPCANFGKALAAEFPAGFRVSFGSDKNDLNIRTGFAWEPFGDGRTVIRGGFGSYTGQFNGLVLGQSRNTFPDFLPLNFANSPRTRRIGGTIARTYLYNPANPLFRAEGLTNLPNVVASGTLNTLRPTESPISILINRLGVLQSIRAGFNDQPIPGLTLELPQEKLSTPYSFQYGVTAEHQFGKNLLASVAYVGTRGIKLLRISTPEGGFNFGRLAAPESPGFPLRTLVSVRELGGSAFPDWSGLLLPPEGQIVGRALAIPRTLFENSASSTYHSLQAELRKRYSDNFQFGSALTYSHSIDDASDYLDLRGAYALPQDSLHRSERASSNFDVRWRSVTHFVLDIPPPFSTVRFGGLQLAGIVTAQTGQPFTVNSAFDINGDGNLTDRLNSTNGLIVGGAAGDRRTQLSIAPGTDPRSLLAPDGQSGAIGRNTFRAPGSFSFDLAMTSKLRFGERREFHYRVEVFNLLNRANYGIPVRILEAPGFGTSVTTTVPARTIQFGLKYLF